MATLGYASLPVPSGGQSPTIPADIAAFAEAVDPHLLHDAANVADRTTRYAGAPAGTVVRSPTGIWYKLAATNTWATVWEPDPVWDRSITPASGIDASQPLKALKVRGQVHMRGRVVRSDGTNLNDPNAVVIGTVPKDLIPLELGTMTAACSMAGPTVQAAGRLEVVGTNSTSAYGGPGTILWWFQDPAGTSWVDITGSYWLI